LSIKSEQLEWRRSKVIELRSCGLTYSEIAKQLQLSKTVVGADMLYVRKQAKENIKEYVTEHLPEQYQICLTAMDTVLKNAFMILSKSEDNREKLQALELFKDTHMTKLELLSDATTIDSALNYVRSKQEQQSPQPQEQEEDDDRATPPDLSSEKSSNQADAETANKQSVF
jgi:hypothetical protein